MKKYPLQEYVSDLLLAWLFAFSLLWGAFQSLQYRFSAGLAALFLFGFALIWILVLRVKWAALGLGLLFFLIVLYWELTMPADHLRTQALLNDWNRFALWVGDAFIHNIPAPQEYLNRALLLMCLGAALLTGLLVRIGTHPVAFLLLGGVLFFIQETFQDILFLPAFFLFLCALSLYALRQAYIRRRKRVHKAAPMFRALAGAVPLCLLAVGLSLLLPASDSALGQPVLDWFNDLDQTSSSVINMRQFTYGGLKKRDGEDDLGGPLRQNNTLLLRIRADRPSYLRAHTYDTYTGRAWKTSDDTTAPYMSLSRTDSHTDFNNELILRLNLPYSYEFSSGYGHFYSFYRGFSSSYGSSSPPTGTLIGGYQMLAGTILRANFETVQGDLIQTPALDKLFSMEYDTMVTGDPFTMRRLTPKPDTVRFSTQQITFENLRSSALFMPQGAVDLSAEHVNGFSLSALGDMSMSRAWERSFTYWVETCDLNLTKPELGDLLRLSGQYLLDTVKSESGIPVGGDNILSAIRDHSQREATNTYGFYGIYFDEIAAPEVLSLPDTVPDRVYALADGLTDGQPTEYDKALAIESYLRNSFPYDLDVPDTPPGRDFVDYFLFDLKRGYCTYYATAMTALCRAAGLPARYVEGFMPIEDKANPGQYLVTGEEAHAWCEVFFIGFGWVTFDPTASLGTTFENRTNPGMATPPPIPSPMTSLPPARPSPTPSLNAPAPSAPQTWTLPAWLGFLLGSIALLCAIPLLQSIRRGRLRRGARTSERAARTIFRRLLRLGACLRISRPERAETPMEWARRADGALHVPPSSSFLAAVELYCGLLFGPEKITAAEITALYTLYNVLLARLKPSISRVKYVLFRHYFGIL